MRGRGGGYGGVRFFSGGRRGVPSVEVGVIFGSGSFEEVFVRGVRWSAGENMEMIPCQVDIAER